MKHQWNKFAAALDYSTYIQALRLSLTSYGFTRKVKNHNPQS